MRLSSAWASTRRLNISWDNSRSRKILAFEEVALKAVFINFVIADCNYYFARSLNREYDRRVTTFSRRFRRLRKRRRLPFKQLFHVVPSCHKAVTFAQ